MRIIEVDDRFVLFLAQPLGREGFNLRGWPSEVQVNRSVGLDHAEEVHLLSGSLIEHLQRFAFTKRLKRVISPLR